MSDHEYNMLQAINAARAARGVHALMADQRLGDAAGRHAADLAAHPWLTEGVAYHTGSDGSSIEQRIREAGYAPAQWREVVGWGWGGDIGPMVQWWLSSPAHVGIVLDADMTDIGVGYATGGAPWFSYWCVDFARPVEAPQPPQEPPPSDAPPLPYHSHVPIVIGSPAPVSAGIDLLDYLRGDGRAYMVQHPGGASEKFRTARDGRRFLQVKNSQWEEFWYDDAFIWRGVDTSPGDGQYYRQFEDGQEGARWCPRFMTVGQQWQAPAEHTVQTYWKSDCRMVDHPRNGRTRNRLTLVARHAALAWNGVTVEDVVEVVSSTGETMFFGRGFGLVAWASMWGSSAIAQLLPANEADNDPEHGCFEAWR